MQRVKFIIPTFIHYSTEIKVRITDINYGGHLGNDSVLSLVHEARVRFLRHFGYSEMNVEGVSLIMGDAAVIYKSEAFQGDLIHIDIALDGIGKAGFDLFYQLIDKQSNKLIASVKTGMVCFDYHQRKIQEVPEKFIQQFKLD